jgi:hypothetical protein
MTIEPQVIFSPDLFAPNESIRLSPAANVSGYPALAAVTFLYDVANAGAAGTQARLVCLGRAAEALASGLPELGLWLLVGQRWQPDTVMARHKRLWKLLESRGIALPSDKHREELCMTSDEGIRFFGIARIAPTETEAAYNIMKASALALLIAARSDAPPTVEEYLGLGWDGPGYTGADFWRDVGSATVRRGGAILQLFGEFDDREVGVDVIVGRDSFDRLRKSMAPR